MLYSEFLTIGLHGGLDMTKTESNVINTKGITINQTAVTFNQYSDAAVEALLPINLTINPGEFVALVGPSGCGKSTLLNVLAGFIKPTTGTAFVGNQPITRPDIDHGVVFQDYALFPWLNVIDNVAFGLERQGVNKKERHERALKNLDMVGLKDSAYKKVTELSGGMKQRAAIARVFATEPSIILMDEPFGALDALTRRFLQHQLLEIWQKNRKSVVFVTHSVQEAVYLANRVIVMTARPGRIKLDHQIDLKYPRDYTSNDFRELEKLVFSQLDEELAKTFSLETDKGYSSD